MLTWVRSFCMFCVGDEGIQRDWHFPNLPANHWFPLKVYGGGGGREGALLIFRSDSGTDPSLSPRLRPRNIPAHPIPLSPLQGIFNHKLKIQMDTSPTKGTDYTGQLVLLLLEIRHKLISIKWKKPPPPNSFYSFCSVRHLYSSSHHGI